MVGALPNRRYIYNSIILHYTIQISSIHISQQHTFIPTATHFVCHVHATQTAAAAKTETSRHSHHCHQPGRRGFVYLLNGSNGDGPQIIRG